SSPGSPRSRRSVSPGQLVRDLPDVHELQAERTHPVQQGVQADLIQVTAQDSRGGLHFDGYVAERLTGRRAKRPDHPDFVVASDHETSFRIRTVILPYSQLSGMHGSPG